jgi:hypothetical protein
VPPRPSSSCPTPPALFYIIFEYDGAIVRLRSASEGSLLRIAGCPTFFGWQAGPPDTVIDCVLGYRTFVLGPGEIVNLEYEALMNGMTPVHFIHMDLRDIDRNPFPDARTVEGVIQVGAGAIGGGAAAEPVPRVLVLAHNPTRGGVAAESRRSSAPNERARCEPSSSMRAAASCTPRTWAGSTRAAMPSRWTWAPPPPARSAAASTGSG